MDRRNFAFDRTNFILLAAGMVAIIIGFILMSGPGSTETVFNPDTEKPSAPEPTSVP